MAIIALLRLAQLTGRADLTAKAVQTLQLFRGLMAQSPTAFGQMLVALDFHLGPTEEFVVVGSRSGEDTQGALRLIQGGFRPNKVVALAEPTANAKHGDSDGRLIPLVAGKTGAAGEVTTYICQDFVCQAPVVGLAALRERLGSAPEAPHSPQTSPRTSSET
jgi:uncharacterized protein YyaL (SSP411 family)